MTRADELAMMRAPEMWPLVLVLPLSHATIDDPATGMPLLGFLLRGAGPIVYVGNVTDLPLKRGPARPLEHGKALATWLERRSATTRHDFDAFESLYDDGWRIN